MSRSKVLKSTSLLSSNMIAVYGLGFVKNVILFRYLSQTDFGIAASFGITTAMFEFVGKMAVDRLIVQAEDGDDPLFQKTAHLFQFIAGMIGAVLTYSFAGPVSQVFDVPESLYAFQWLALIPFLRGLMHLDISRMQRDMRFGPMVMVQIVPQFITLGAVWPLVLWLGDYRAALLLVLTKTAMTVVGTHVIAERSYRWGWHKDFVKRIVAFSWPLLINGFLIFALRQGDQLFVGAGYTMADLAAYNVAVSLSVEPGIMFVGVLISVMLPLLSRHQSDAVAFGQKYVLSLQLLSVAAAIFMSGVVLAGPLFLTLMYGAKAAGSHVFLVWLAASQALRLLRVAPNIASMAKADTSNVMIANLYRLTGVGLAAAVAFWKLDLYLIAVAALAGEALALTASIARLARTQERVLLDLRLPLGYLICIVLLVAVLKYCGIHSSGWLTVLLATTSMVILALGAGFLLFPPFRHEVLLFKEHLLRRLKRSDT